MTAPRATLHLPALPVVELETVRETRLGEGGFLVLRRMELVAVQEGARSASFVYDAIAPIWSQTDCPRPSAQLPNASIVGD